MRARLAGRIRCIPKRMGVSGRLVRRTRNHAGPSDAPCAKRPKTAPVLVIALVQRVHNNHNRPGQAQQRLQTPACAAVHFSQPLQHQPLPLVVLRQGGDITLGAHGAADVRAQRRHRGRQLRGDSGDEVARAGAVAAAAREEEAGAEPLPGGAAARDGARDGRLARAGEAAEPEDVALVARGGPGHDLVEQRHARALVACAVVGARRRVELGAAHVRQRAQQGIVIDAAAVVVGVTGFSRRV